MIIISTTLYSVTCRIGTARGTGRAVEGAWKLGAGQHTPDLVIVAFLAEAGSYGCTLLLDDGALVCDGLCGADVPNELLD